MRYLKANKYLLLFIISAIVFFSPFFFQKKLPIPADTLVGLYHPWRDLYADDYPNGYPYKNPLITDPIRQQYPYRILAIEELKKGRFPNWNPYSFSGTPLLANIQTAAFYPLNILFWFFESQVAWSLLVFLQPFLAGIFLYAYLKNLGLGERACFLGAITFSFSGFMVSWLEWNTIGHTALWMPLILLAKDKLVRKFSWLWAGILVFSETSMILGGHLQTALYVLVFTSLYLWFRIWQFGRHDKKILTQKGFLFSLTGATVIILTSFQWLLALEFILSSARAFDLPDWHRPDWFIPWQNLIQFIAPDFFGNPATGNYYGIWNYGEFIGYVALFPLLMAAFAILGRRDKKTLFYGSFLGISALLAVPNWISQLPYILKIPLLSTLQPSRILVLIDFCLAVLAAFGLDYIVKPEKERDRRLLRIVVFGVLVIMILWLLVLFGPTIGLSKEFLNVQIAQRNLALPTGIFVLSAFGMLGLSRFALKKIFLTRIFIVILLFATLFDFYRFFHKFTPFVDAGLLFPTTKSIEFLKENIGNHRLMTMDRRILPPNVTTKYKLQSVDGYDPLYLKNYGEAMAAWTRELPDISPASFNRILTPENIRSFWTDLLGVKYVLSLNPRGEEKLQLVFEEGETRVYENLSAFPRAFLVEQVIPVSSKEEVIRAMYENTESLGKVAYTDEQMHVVSQPLSQSETAEILHFTPNRVTIRTYAEIARLLVLSDIYFPSWEVYIDGTKSQILNVDYILRGVIVPQGESSVEFRL